MKKIFFLAFSGAILIFAIISICCAPIINGDIIGASTWKTKNCKLDQIKKRKLLFYIWNFNQNNFAYSNICN